MCIKRSSPHKMVSFTTITFLLLAMFRIERLVSFRMKWGPIYLKVLRAMPNEFFNSFARLSNEEFVNRMISMSTAFEVRFRKSKKRRKNDADRSWRGFFWKITSISPPLLFYFTRNHYAVWIIIKAHRDILIFNEKFPWISSDAV